MIGFGQDKNVIYRKDLSQGSKYLLEGKFQSKQKYIQTHIVEDRYEEEQILSDTTRKTSIRNRNSSSKKRSKFDPIMSPYPVILIHGLIGDWRTWDGFNDTLASFSWMDGDYLDFCLNDYGSTNQDLCKLNHEIKDHTVGQISEGDLYIINFDCDRNECDTAVSANNSVFSNQASIVVQGEAIGIAIDRILTANSGLGSFNPDKVILMGHSMGGLAAREYIENSSHWRYDPNSHRVAKLITTGTPHGGSNKSLGVVTDILDAMISFFSGASPLTEKSEAVRDLRTSYSNGKPGAYLFGSPPMEEDDADIHNGGSPYKNVDINCDGDELDGVVGLNTAPSIPGNLERTCIVGTSDLTTTIPNSTIEGSDGLVDTAEANINNYYNAYAEVFKINAEHLELTNEQKSLYTNFKALDEPEAFDYAYKILPEGDSYGGYSTWQAPNHWINLPANIDIDSYYFIVNQYSLIDIQVDDLNTNGSVELFTDDSNYTSQALANANSTGTAMIQKYLTPGKYYIDITADAYDMGGGNYPWNNPYYFTVSTLWTSGISESLSQNRTLLKTIDVLGREIKGTKNEVLFYIYDDGTVEKRIVVE